jgi:peptidyl-prolyl cis-trans isomerase D
MLKQLRSRKVMKRIMKIALFLVIPSFIGLYGWSSMKQGPRNTSWYYVKVKESPLQLFRYRWSKIPEQDLKEAKKNLVAEYSSMMGRQNQNLAPVIDKIISPSDIVTKAINERQLYNLAKTKGLHTDRAELAALIQEMYPQDPKRALQYLMSMQGYSSSQEQEFEYDQLKKMTIQKSKFLFSGQAKASLFELWQEYLLMEEKVNLEYVLFKAEDFKEKVKLTDAKISDVYEDNKENYRIPDQVKYDYIAIKQADLVEESKVSEEEIKEYYEDNKNSEFTVKRNVKIRHIMKNFPEDATDEQLKDIQFLMVDLYTTLTLHNADFAEIADFYTDDPINSRMEYGPDRKPTGKMIKNGGLISRPLSEDDLDKSSYGTTFVKTALKLKKGQISSLIEGERGFHIIKVETINPEKIMSYENSKDQSEYALKKEKGEQLFAEKKKILYEKFEETTTLSGLAKQLGIKTGETPLVDTGTTYFPKIGGLFNYKDEIAELTIGERSNLFETPTLLAAIVLKESVNSHIPELKTIKDKVEKDATMEVAAELAGKEAKKFLKIAVNTEQFKIKADEKEYKILTPDPFTHTKAPAEISSIKNFAQITIRTKEGSVKLSEIPTRGMGSGRISGYAVWALKNKIEPDKKKFREDLLKLQREVISGKQQTLVNENLADLTKGLQFEVNPLYLGIK